MTSTGRVRLPQAGLDLVAVGLTSDEARGCAALIAAGEDLNDQPIPTDDTATEGWRAYTDAAGALRREHTIPRHTPAQDILGDTTCLLPAPDEDYTTRAATTTQDLADLAPQVPARVRQEVHDADPDLDADVTAWFADDCPLPRLTLLGPVKARTRGTPLVKRKPYMTAVLAYLWSRPHGATPDELADAMNVSVGKGRVYARDIREWLGTNPRTGDQHLPDARRAPEAQARGIGVYQVQDLLVDADLFRRLRVRGQARGAEGLPDLVRALDLVQGPPFSQVRADAWSWLHEGDRLDHHLTCAVVDVAHLVITHALHTGRHSHRPRRRQNGTAGGSRRGGRAARPRRRRTRRGPPGRDAPLSAHRSLQPHRRRRPTTRPPHPHPEHRRRTRLGQERHGSRLAAAQAMGPKELQSTKPLSRSSGGMTRSASAEFAVDAAQRCDWPVAVSRHPPGPGAAAGSSVSAPRSV